MFKIIWNWLYLRYHLGSSTPIKLWQADVIRGLIVYELHAEKHEYIMQWYKDLKTLPIEKTKENLNRRWKRVEQKYFGPKWVKAEE